MIAKEKAIELVEKFQKQIFFDITNERLDIEEAKGCALICIDEIINCDSFFKTLEDTKAFTKYWYEVQQEINKL